MPPEQHVDGVFKDSRLVFVIATVAILLAIGFVFFYTNKKTVPTAQPESLPTPEVVQEAPEEKSLGGALYEKANNPLEEKLPDQTPMANPIDDAYKNPF